jgi:hypothetical protein
MRYTGQWIQIYTDLTVDEYIEAVRYDPYFSFCICLSHGREVALLSVLLVCHTLTFLARGSYHIR